MCEGLTAEEIHEAIDRIVCELLDAAGVAVPPVDVVELARRLGVSCDPDRRGRGRAQAALRAEPSAERRQWTAAHALGQHRRDDLFRRLGIDPAEGRGPGAGSLVNLFADRLLVPTTWLADAARQVDFDLLALKERFRTASHELIAWRLLDLPEACIVTVIDNDQVSRRRGNTGRAPRELADAEKRCLAQVQRYSRPAEVNEGAWRVQGWPVHQVDWRREILRSQVEED